LLAAVGSGSAAEPRLREYVDEVTAVSITVPVDTLVFARERTDLAANARDYVTLVPLEINRGGVRSYFWSGYIWSTIDRRGRSPVVDAKDRLVLLADGRPLALEASARTLREQGVGQPPTPVPARTATAVLFAARADEIAYAAHARDLRIQVVREGNSDSFLLWKDARSGLREFTTQLGLER
jgi:hypothetical protein